ncbi:hypothetical protein ACFL6X_03295 [Candidatus Latescibacterota bacterium]
MDWAPKIKVARLRQLYHSQSHGRLSERAMLDVGWGLHALCEDVVAAATAFHLEEVPCPNCGVALQRRGIARPTVRQREALLQARGYAYGWFHCDHCQTRLLWQDCRDALRTGSARFTCHCGKSWTARQFRDSLARRKWLPCPNCDQRVQRPVARPVTHSGGMRLDSAAAHACSRCGAVASRSGRRLVCGACGYAILWRSRKLALKRRDERLHCESCGHDFGWQDWRRKARRYATGNRSAAAQFLENWPSSADPDQQMMHIDILVQALHGRGTPAPVFIEGTPETTRGLLDELAGLP